MSVSGKVTRVSLRAGYRDELLYHPIRRHLVVVVARVSCTFTYDTLSSRGRCLAVGGQKGRRSRRRS